MRRKLTHSVIGAALVATAIAAPPAIGSAGAQGWSGFETTSVPSSLNAGGVNISPAFSAAITEDLAGDGVDLFVNNHAERSEWLVDWNGSSTVFANVAAAAGGFDSHGAVFSDIDGDGDDDLVESSGRGHDTRVFKNNNGALSAISNHGLEDNLGRGRTVLMADVDGDGDMDAVIANLDRRFLPGDDEDTDQNNPDIARPSEVYLNNGNGTSFTKMADPNEVLSDESIRYLHLTSTGPGEAPVLITSNSFVFGLDTVAVGSNTLTAAASPVVQSLGPDDNATTIRDIALGDLDGDLAPEAVFARQQDFLGQDALGAQVDPSLEGELPMMLGQVSTNRLTPDVLVPISNNALADNCRAIALADFDNDADLDIFGGCAMEENGQTRDIVLLNDGSGNFSLGAASLVPATGASTSTVAITADFNQDGWIDTYVGGSYDNQPGEDHIFLNRGGTNNWLMIDLVGSNPDVMGAQVFVGTNKWQVRETGHRTHRGQDMKTLHFGLGSQTALAPIEIMWPDGSFERCDVAGVNQRVTIEQGGDNCVSSTKAALVANVNAAPDTSETAVTTAPPVALCNNLPVTVDLSKGESPTNGDDVIRGTAGNDIINSLGGNDTICALQGNDIINGGDGFDRVFAGAGDDRIDGGAGNDILVGGDGADTILGGTGNDRLQGGGGVDDMNGGGGLDRLAGNNGNDILRGGTHDDLLFGNLGRDQLFGDGGNDVLRGGAWKDVMDGGAGANDGCTLTDPGGLTETRINCEGGVFGR